MTELERRKERKEKLLFYRAKRIEIAKLIIKYCQNFIWAEEQLLKETDKEQIKILHESKVTAKWNLLLLFTRFKEPFKE